MVRCLSFRESYRCKRAVLYGATLIEVTIAIGVVAIALIAVLGLMTFAVNGTHSANLRQRLSTVIQTENSIFQATDFSNATTQVSLPAYYSADGLPVTNSAAYYFQCTTLNVTPASAPSKVQILQLQVAWPYPQRTSTNISLMSFFNYQ